MGAHSCGVALAVGCDDVWIAICLDPIRLDPTIRLPASTRCLSFARPLRDCGEIAQTAENHRCHPCEKHRTDLEPAKTVHTAQAREDRDNAD
jgi:hypothetical protein